jgi:hypothetical protein
MKKFKCTEEGVWQEVTRVVSEETDVTPEKVLVPASPEDTLKLEEIYLANKPKLSGNHTYSLISASIKMNETSKSGKIRSRINGGYKVIDIK